LANNLKHATVVEADGTRRSVLEEERVAGADAFVACTGDDENNIMAGVEARDIGAQSIMAIVGRPDYANVVGKLGIDLAVSPRDVMAKQVLGYLNAGPVVSRTTLAGSSIGVFEIEVLEGVLATEQVLANLKLPNQCLITAVMREEFVRVPGADDRLKPGDTVVALVENEAVDGMLRLFSPNGR
jgi:trk system potassium uptake protein TrkA